MITAPNNLAAWDRVMDAIEQVRDRLLRATAALERAQVPYAVIGGNAVSVWVGRRERAAVRFTKDVDLALRRADLGAATQSMWCSQAKRFVPNTSCRSRMSPSPSRMNHSAF